MAAHFAILSDVLSLSPTPGHRIAPSGHISGFAFQGPNLGLPLHNPRKSGRICNSSSRVSLCRVELYYETHRKNSNGSNKCANLLNDRGKIGSKSEINPAFVISISSCVFLSYFEIYFCSGPKSQNIETVERYRNLQRRIHILEASERGLQRAKTIF